MVKQNKNMKTETKIEYRKNGQIKHKCDYVNGNMHGEGISYYKDGTIKWKYSYVNDLRHGECFEYYDDGDIEKIINFVNGKQHGEYIEYHTNGNLMKKTDYVNDQVHGKYIEYHTNGNLMEKTDYVNGIAHGECTICYYNGQIKSKCDYVNGKRCGKCASYDEFGFCTDRFDIDANGEYVTYEKWNRIYGTNGYVTYKQRSSTEMYMYIKEGDIFYCEGRYYEITRGSLKCGNWEIKKSTNLQIRHLEWQLDSAYIEIIDDAKKEIIDCSVYKLKPSGNKFTKFLTAKKNFNITVMNNAELVVKHKEVERRENFLYQIIRGIDKTLFPEMVIVD